MYDGGMWGDGRGWGGWASIGVGMVLFWVVVITVIVFAVRYLMGSGGASGGPVPAAAEGVLAGRFARGEIYEDEYRQRIALLHERR
nr:MULTISPECIES: SHOCT domain-containing protein [Mycobacterium]